MSNKEILDEVYNRLVEGKNMISGYASLVNFIEREWQKEDERLSEEADQNYENKVDKKQ